MTNNVSSSNAGSMAGINPERLFAGSCFALISTSVCFAVIGAIMGGLKEQFVLTNEQVGVIAGAATVGFTPAIFILGPLCDTLGMRNLMWLAFIGHFAGALMMIFAPNFTMLVVGAFTLSLANGTVEAACNPLVATIFPDQKTRKLNQFHVWFPGGIVLGSVIAAGLNSMQMTSWKLKLVLILIPTVIYFFLFLGQKFPATERVQSGISFGGMCQATFGRVLFWVLLFCMCITASLELGPNRWVSSVLEAGGIPGLLVLAWISGLMAVLRFFAGPIVHKFSPTGILVGSAVLAGVGLLGLSHADTSVVAFLMATVFAVGVCYFWPTMIGVTAERVPKGGALAMALMGGMGMLAVGSVTTPLMGKIADKQAHTQLTPAQTNAVFAQTLATYPVLKAQAKGETGKDFDPAIKAVQDVMAQTAKDGGKLPEIATANALREIIKAAPTSDAAKAAQKELGPADNFGGRISFRRVAPFSIILIVVFGSLFLSDRMKGGYKVEKIMKEAA